MGPGSRCARPGRRWLGPSEGPTCGCTKWRPAQFHCFRIVIYNGFCNRNVSSVSAAFAHPGGGETPDQQQEPEKSGEHRRPADAATRARLARAKPEPVVTVVGLARAYRDDARQMNAAAVL